ncbi:hypothetical protein [Cohnella soli]|uniref:Uncharacterized protein n=1 Tax=Cohnella soli TaxID=425005 RepID=A0ABW0HWA4_9BACL
MSGKTVKQEQAEQLQVAAERAEPKVRQDEELVMPGRFGVTNKQLIPAIKGAIAAGDVERLSLLKERYLYIFANSQRYLKKTEREYIAVHLKT